MRKPHRSRRSKRPYLISFLTVAGLLLIGFAMEATLEFKPEMPAFPVNLYLGVGFVNLLILMYLLFSNAPLLRWLVSVPASIASISAYLLLILLMGFIPQTDQSSPAGLHQILSSWPFVLAQSFLLMTLGLVTVKRAIPFRWANWGFLANHLGLWMVIMAAALGSGDFYRLSLPVYEKQSMAEARDEEGKWYQLPFEVELHDFDIKQYHPRVALVRQGAVVSVAFLSGQDLTINWEGWEIAMRRLPNSSYQFQARKGGYIVKQEMTVPAHGDVSAASLNAEELLVLFPPEPREYLSRVTIRDEEGELDTVIRVNEPVKFSGWKIYQSGYDEKAGKESGYSLLEVVRDPWLPVVFTGFFMLIIGSLYLIIQNHKIRRKHDLG